MDKIYWYAGQRVKVESITSTIIKVHVLDGLHAGEHWRLTTKQWLTAEPAA